MDPLALVVNWAVWSLGKHRQALTEVALKFLTEGGCHGARKGLEMFRLGFRGLGFRVLEFGFGSLAGFAFFYLRSSRVTGGLDLSLRPLS